MKEEKTVHADKSKQPPPTVFAVLLLFSFQTGKHKLKSLSNDFPTIYMKNTKHMSANNSTPDKCRIVQRHRRIEMGKITNESSEAILQ